MTPARVDAELVRRGLARSRAHAAELVKAGRVSAEGRSVSKPSVVVPDDAAIDVVPDPADPGYASRAALKLAGALDALAADDAGRRLADAVESGWCLDLGASTGGFTDVLLRRGAAHVVALDVGHDQLVARLRDDPRVTVVEGYNVRDLDRADLDRSPDLVVGDLSFISLTLVLPALAAVLDPGAPALLLVKPQFEVGRERLGTGGVVRDPALHVDAVLDVIATGARTGLRAHAVVPSPLPGPSGNREYFVAFERGEATDGDEVRADALAAVRAAVAWIPEELGTSRPPALALGVGRRDVDPVGRAAAVRPDSNDHDRRPGPSTVPEPTVGEAPAATPATPSSRTGGAS
ncbi:hemolysin A [Xylanimonas cellulosilytica DSM 15894]|uniref:Hemolysin A n=1 Tax=Xylanimonas cellulosilytica (strain DSM 15894 / JCM 12276 / CECT 5975 / KCTC 9989 / LMG 20990 / NBRC 107835 / XIL07) TaxID=446471 RepID=D1BRB6_XYLCX|nr:TlyA family RNA methyltransferase [Xylanimonas cellulosilytica]ACZ30371.1 hemolysin A [Xylanimonas cellulosilytica DSM 15894]